MLALTMKEIRDILAQTLNKFFSEADYSLRQTEVRNDLSEFRVGFKIYDDQFWMDVNPTTQIVQVLTRSIYCEEKTQTLNAVHVCLFPPMFRYDKEQFRFDWRTDLECFFDEFSSALINAVKASKRDVLLASLEKDYYGSGVRDDIPKADKTKLAQVVEAMQNEKSVVSQCIDAVYNKHAETKTKEVKTSIFNGLKDDEDDDEDDYI